MDVANVIRADNVQALRLIEPESYIIVQGEYVLHYCVHKKAIRCVEWLLSLPHVDVDSLDSKGYPPIYYAVDNLELFSLLVENGARIDGIYNTFGNIFSRLLSDRSNPECLKYLLHRIRKKANTLSGNNDQLKAVVFRALVNNIRVGSKDITRQYFDRLMNGKSQDLKKFLNLLRRNETNDDDDDDINHVKRIVNEAIVSPINYYDNAPTKKNNLFNIDDFLDEINKN